MHLIRALFVSSLIASVNAHASSEAHVQGLLDNYQASVADHANAVGQPAPEVTAYQYGMNLDVVNVVSRSPMPTSCHPVPMRMTYEDTSGRLSTVQYIVEGKCRPQQE